MAANGGVLIVAEAGGGELRPASYELVTAGRRLAGGLGGQLTALLMGSGIDEAASQLASTGVDRVLIADDSRLTHMPVDAATAVIERVVRDVAPAAVLIPGTTAGIEYAPRLAARLRVGLASDCIDFAVEDGALIAVRPVLGGRVQTAVKFGESRPQLATVRLGSFEQASPVDGGPTPERVQVELADTDLRIRVIGVAQKEEAGGVALEEATVIVGGGRGLKEPKNFELVEELASALSGAVAATRAVTDAGWRPHHEQVGQTGRTIAPRLYIAVGISGAVQHLVGIQGSDYIVAINRDPDAPIFKTASFGIVGDLFEVVPALIAELKAARA
ncbi:MAG: electron transfer flavoprotein alpha subunit [Thermomicrobiales bacterium]|nr:electron transfer flavoprotein alpha subunit [Thermomicrobiales bacterium]